MEDAVTRLVSEWFKAWNRHDAERLVSLCAQDYSGLDIAEAGPQQGRDAIRKSIERYLQAFPDLVLGDLEMIAQANQVAVKWTADGTHQGSWMNIPPTGRHVTVRGTSFFTLADGLIKQGLSVWDLAGFLREIGLLPELPHS